MSKYYVVEVVFDKEQKSSYITYSKSNPEEDVNGILMSFKSKEIPELNEWLSQKKSDYTDSFIQLDVTDSVDEALEMVEVWKNYYQFLGLTAVT